MRMKPVSMSRVSAGGLILAVAIAASSSAQSPAPSSSGENKVQLTTGRIFNVFGDGSEHIRKMRERLNDPQQRAALREEQRGHIVYSHGDVAEALQLDAATYEKLIEVLTDQHMAQLEGFHQRDISQPPLDMTSHLQAHTERQNRELDALRQLLGPEKLERYQAYRSTLGERYQLRELDPYLNATDRLSPAQKEKMIELLRDHNQRVMRGHHSMMRSRASLSAGMRQPLSQEDLQRRSQLMHIESSEDHWRRMPESNRQLRERASAFLTPSQLAALEQAHAERLKLLQQSIEQMRVEAGLSPDIPAQAEAAEPPPAKVARDVRVRIKTAVNQGKPVSVTEIVSSGKAVTFEMDEGLLVQATPIVYANDTYELRVEYFEQGTTGRRLIGNMGNVGTLQPAPPVADAPMGSSATIISGSKAYGIELSASVEAI
jgi:hypothetical protein